MFCEALVTLAALIYASEARKAIRSVSPAKVTFDLPTVILASKGRGQPYKNENLQPVSL
jgi:hypothetical protein